MGGTFSSVNGALSALRYHQVVMDTASANIANVSTEGYTRRRVNGETVGPAAAPAMWSRSDDSVVGVRVSGVQRMADAFLDARARFEHGSQSYLDTRRVALERVEAGVGEPGPNGVAAALAQFRNGLHDLANDPGSDAARSQVLARASGLADALRIQSRNVAVEESDQRFRLLSTVDEVNTVASDLAATNRSIAAARLSGTDAATLMDTRDALALRLAQLTGAQATPRADGGLDVTVNGLALVTGTDAARMEIATGVTPGGEPDGAPVTFALVPASGTATAVPGEVRGETGATAELLTTTLPAYRAGLDVVARTLADELNAQHASGFDRAGDPGQPLFAYDAADPAGTLTVALADPALVAASGIPGGGLDAGNATAMIGRITVEDDYQRLVNGLGSEVASVRRLALNQQTLTAQVDASREQLAGVNLDEEMVTMLTAQRAYEAAARVMTTVDSVLDTLINRTGLVR